MIAKMRNVLLALLLLLYPLAQNRLVQAQSQSLTTTEWIVTAKNYYEGQVGTSVVAVYSFASEGRVTFYLTFVYAPPPQTTYDINLGWRTTYYNPEMKTLKDSNGVFERTGDSVVIKFSDHFIRATRNGNRMSGQLTDKRSGRSFTWAASKDAGKNPPDGTSTYTNVTRESDGKLRPANGYDWVNSNDPRDFRVKRIQ
ncbi:MAG TPA: hypothetical protein VJV03_10130 [Pyrinomonadaceae bacterium]|nr:hypothetical protein [Pyrinomonadaceae bacterium]